jgi:hypothetical protein
MNKLAVLLLAAIASNGALAGEVGANLQSAEPVTLAYVVADTGTNNANWAIGPINTPVSAAEHSQITRVADAMNEQVILEVSVKLYKTLEDNF